MGFFLFLFRFNSAGGGGGRRTGECGPGGRWGEMKKLFKHGFGERDDDDGDDDVGGGKAAGRRTAGACESMRVSVTIRRRCVSTTHNGPCAGALAIFAYSRFDVKQADRVCIYCITSAVIMENACSETRYRRRRL